MGVPASCPSLTTRHLNSPRSRWRTWLGRQWDGCWGGRRRSRIDRLSNIEIGSSSPRDLSLFRGRFQTRLCPCGSDASARNHTSGSPHTPGRSPHPGSTPPRAPELSPAAGGSGRPSECAVERGSMHAELRRDLLRRQLRVGAQRAGDLDLGGAERSGAPDRGTARTCGDEARTRSLADERRLPIPRGPRRGERSACPRRLSCRSPRRASRARRPAARGA